MGWEMEMDELEAVLEKIWDLHDKLSDAILSITRSHYLHSLKSLRKSDAAVLASSGNKADDDLRAGFVFVKDFPVDDDYSAVQEAKSLKAIRTALENLEDQLEFFHTVQVQQRAERDAAIARLEQSRIILAMRLAEHHGKKYKVIEEALAFVGDVRDTGHFVSPENLYGSAPFRPVEQFAPCEGRRSSNIIKFLISGFEFTKRSLKIGQLGGILGNAALVAISMLALLHLHQVPYKGKQVLEVPGKQEDAAGYNTSGRKVSSWLEDSSTEHLTNLDVMLARG